MQKPETTASVRVFFSYSHEDESYRLELENSLANLRRGKIIDVWYDDRIAPGDDFDRNIKSELEAADLILFLVSRDFLSSKYIWEVEVPLAMQRYEAGDARIIPIILRPCDWKDTCFKTIEALPKHGRPMPIRFPQAAAA